MSGHSESAAASSESVSLAGHVELCAGQANLRYTACNVGGKAWSVARDGVPWALSIAWAVASSWARMKDLQAAAAAAHTTMSVSICKPAVTEPTAPPAPAPAAAAGATVAGHSGDSSDPSAAGGPGPSRRGKQLPGLPKPAHYNSSSSSDASGGNDSSPACPACSTGLTDVRRELGACMAAGGLLPAA